jgi:hypothetical protein
MAFKMKGFSGFGNSPMKKDVDTTWVDQVYSKAKVDENLKKSGYHTEGRLRGKKKSKYHHTGKGNLKGADIA